MLQNLSVKESSGVQLAGVVHVPARNHVKAVLVELLVALEPQHQAWILLLHLF
jgi:hypothetical protein